MSVNKVTLLGFVGKDPEIRTTQDGKEIANFNLATSEYWKDKNGERKESSEWHRIVVFNQILAKVVREHIHKGSKVYVEGQIKSRKYKDRDGIERNITEIVVSQYKGELQVMEKKEVTNYVDKEPVLTSEIDLDDNIPF